MEEHKLLPENQHGFRAKRSTMTAWANIQQEWAQNTEKNQTTGVMLWDLSAAFDTLDAEILIQKAIGTYEFWIFLVKILLNSVRGAILSIIIKTILKTALTL